MKSSVFILALLTVASIWVPGAYADQSKETSALQERQVQSRTFSGLAEEQILSATVNVLQDMGYQIDDSESALGVITASKTHLVRDKYQLEAKALAWRDSLPNKELTEEDCSAPFAALLTGEFFSKLVDSFHCSTIKDIAPIAERQIIRASVTINKSNKRSGTDASTQNSWLVRIIFQASSIRPLKAGDPVSEFDAQVLKDPSLYQAFFNKLSKAIFIEAQDL